jgi:hypothetical protein
MVRTPATSPCGETRQSCCTAWTGAVGPSFNGRSRGRRHPAAVWVGTGGCGWTAGIEHTRRRRCGRFRRGAALDRRVDRLQTSFAGSGQTLPVSREPGRRLLPPESVGATALRRQVGAPARELPPRGPRAAGLAREPRVNPLPNEPGRIARALLNLRVCVPGTRSGVGIRESMINRLIDHSNTRIRNEGAQF